MDIQELEFLIYGENLFKAKSKEEYDYIEQNYICYPFDWDEHLRSIENKKRKDK